MAKITELKKKYQGEWLAIDISKYENYKPVEGILLLHDADRERLWNKIEMKTGKRIYVTFAGSLIEEGYAVAFSTVRS